MTDISYIKAKNLLLEASSPKGFLASANEVSNYKRIWARDGVITGLAALLDGNKKLIETFRQTLISLAENQHDLGHIPSNVHFKENKTEISFGGLAGRVDTISWFVIGVCNYAKLQKDTSFIEQFKPNIEKCFRLLDCWEFNNNHLLYVPKSGNWADEYITEGHILYDQILRLWALRCFIAFYPEKQYIEKIEIITNKILDNYKSGNIKEPYHPKAYKDLKNSKYFAASINPSGYQNMFDAFGNSLVLLLDVDKSSFRKKILKYSENLRKSLPLQLLPAFWEPIDTESIDWEQLKNNCKYEFRNMPFQFHNGGTWQMVNSFYGIALVDYDIDIAVDVLKYIKKLNKIEDYGFYENFDTKLQIPNGVKKCTWSAAGEILLEQYINGKKLLL